MGQTNTKSLVVTIAAGIAGGLLGLASGLPGGPLLGSLLAVAALRRRRPVRWPPAAFVGAQILIGSAAGAMVTRSTLSDFAAPMLLGVVISAAVALIGCGCGFLLTRWSRVDPWSAVIAFAPGGLSELVAIAESHGVRTEVIVGVHLLRRLVTIGAVLVIAAVALQAP